MTADEFFQHLLDMFTVTSGSEDTYWDYEDTGETGFDVHSVDQYGEGTFVGYFDNEVDADFVTAIHGCLPDLVRRLKDSIEKADNYELAHDQCQRELFEAEQEIAELKSLVTEYEADLQGLIAR